MDPFELVCCSCRKQLTLNSRYPKIGPAGEMCCSICIAQRRLEWPDADVAFITTLKQELVHPDCCSSPCHPDGNHPLNCRSVLEAASINSKSFKVYCSAHTQDHPDYMSLERNSIKDYMISALKRVSEDATYPPEYLAEFRGKLWGTNFDAKQILSCLKKKTAFDADGPICSTHLNTAEYIEVDKYLFKCANCVNGTNPASERLDLALHVQRAKDECRNAKTFAFTSTILSALKTNHMNPKQQKDFLLDMNFLVSNKNDNLDQKSRCLFCHDLFNVGEKTPIQLHSEEKHEVCYACFISGRVRTCPIDNIQVTQQIIPAKANFLYKFRDRTCANDHTDGKPRFSYCNDSIPYALPCGHNLCQDCLSACSTINVLKCKRCCLNMDPRKVVPNKFIECQLVYIDLLCEDPNHPNQVIRYYNKDDMVVYCQKCQGLPGKYRNVIDPDGFNTELNRRLQELGKIYEHPIIRLIVEQSFLYTLSNRLGLFRYLSGSPNFTRHLRTSPKIFPLNYDSFNRWTPHQITEENLNIYSNVIMLIYGLLIGKGVSAPGNLIISSNNRILVESRIEASTNINDRIQEVYFPQSYDLTEAISIDLRFSPGDYFHGDAQRENQLITTTSKIKFDMDKYIELSSDSRVNRYFANGGPVLGLIASKFYANKS